MKAGRKASSNQYHNTPELGGKKVSISIYSPSSQEVFILLLKELYKAFTIQYTFYTKKLWLRAAQKRLLLPLKALSFGRSFHCLKSVGHITTIVNYNNGEIL